MNSTKFLTPAGTLDSQNSSFVKVKRKIFKIIFYMLYNFYLTFSFINLASGVAEETQRPTINSELCVWPRQLVKKHFEFKELFQNMKLIIMKKLACFIELFKMFVH